MQTSAGSTGSPASTPTCSRRAASTASPELAQRNAGNLQAALEQTNETKKLVRRVPSESEVARWIEQAKGLPKAVHH